MQKRKGRGVGGREGGRGHCRGKGSREKDRPLVSPLKRKRRERDGGQGGDAYACRWWCVEETRKEEKEGGRRCDTEGARCVVFHCPPQGLHLGALQS